MNPRSSWATFLLAVLLLGATAASADSFRVRIHTTPDHGALVGPLSLRFDLMDGSFIGDANNSVLICGLTTNNGAISNPSACDSLSDNGFPASKDYALPSATTDVWFLMSVSNSPDSFVPDQLAVYLFDGTLPIATSDVLGANALFAMDLGVGPSVTPAIFEGTGDDAGVRATLSQLPEPATILLMTAAAPLVLSWHKRRAYSRRQRRPSHEGDRRCI